MRRFTPNTQLYISALEMAEDFIDIFLSATRSQWKICQRTMYWQCTSQITRNRSSEIYLKILRSPTTRAGWRPDRNLHEALRPSFCVFNNRICRFRLLGSFHSPGTYAQALRGSLLNDVFLARNLGHVIWGCWLRL